MRRLISHISFIVLLLFTVMAQAQISADKTSGCAPLTKVQFSYPFAVDWDFDDGSFATNSASVEHSFGTAGSYTVSVSQGGGVLETIDIEVFPKPTPSFNLTGDASGCVPHATSFEDASVGGGGTSITDWAWTFGDGGGDNVEDPNYTYTLTGTFSVSLIVTDQNGCDSSVTQNDIITVTSSPTAAFTTNPSPASACTGPLTVSFTNFSTNSTGGTTDLTYEWDFGDGTNSTDQNPADVTYTAEGNYLVSLTVTEAGGCSRTTFRTVTIGNPEAIPDVPDTVCLNEFIPALGNVSTGASSYIWEFQNGPTYGVTNPSHTFSTAGDQQITLTANSSQGCSDDTTFVIYVEEVDVDFTRTPTLLCEEPYCFSFDGQTSITNVQSYQWEFDNGILGPDAVSEDTTFCFHINDTTYYVHDPYYRTNSFTVVSTNGCRGTISYTDTIHPISAFFFPDTSMGCAPFTVQFLDSTRSHNDIVSWEYDFGDGGSSSVQNPSYTFTNPGEYEVTLIAENQSGCRDTSYPVTILVGDVQNIDFDISPTSICVGDSVTFSDLSGNTNVDYWHYEVNGNKSTFCPSSSTQGWKDFDEVGNLDVTLHTNYNGCISTNTKAGALEVRGPISDLKYTGLCANPLDYTFIGTIQGATSWDWDFGDGTVIASSTDSTVTHSYAASGDFTAELITYNNSSGCENDTQRINVNVRQIQAVINGDSSICEAVGYNFDGSASVDVYDYCSDAYRWDLGDQTEPRLRDNGSIDFSFPDTGDYNVRLIVHDINNCRDTAIATVRVNEIIAEIGYDTLQGCLPFTIALADSSVSDTIINEWSWSVDGIPYATSKDTSLTITDQDNKDIRLIVTDSLGCKDTTQIVATPIVPDTNFVASTDRTICVGDSVNFNFSDSAAVATANWTFDALGSSTDKSPYFTFGQEGLFSVTAAIVDTNGCSGANTRTDYVTVQDYPDGDFTVYPLEDTIGVICYPENISFSSVTKGAGYTYDWDLGALGDNYLPIDSISETFQNKGVYDVQLIVTTTFGCADTVEKDIELAGPVADFDMSSSLICAGDSITFTIKDTADVFHYYWDYGDGQSSPSETSPVTHPYNDIPSSLSTSVLLLYWGKDSVCPNTVAKPLAFESVLANFGISQDTMCLNENLAVVDSSQGADSYLWTVSDGNTYTTGDIGPLRFSNAGDYTIELIVENDQLGCVDTLIKDVKVHPIPAVSSYDTSYCEGDIVTLRATADPFAALTWTPTSFVVNPDSAITEASIDSSTLFTIVAIDTNDCSNNVNSNIFIQHPYDPITIDTCVVIGELIPLGADLGAGFTYEWTGAEADLAWLECTACSTQVIQITDEVDEIQFTLNYTDTLSCFTNEAYYNICILPSYTFDVPSAFTPDGDGINDIVYVRGHGIKALEEFKIFNRWGELVFESTSLDVGWDGMFKGNEQGMETYIYKVSVEFWNGEKDSKGGSITLIR